MKIWKTVKVCVIRLDHICFEKSSSTFWQVRYCAHRTWRFCQKYDKDSLNFVAFSEIPNFMWFVWRKTFEESRVGVQGVESHWGDCRFIPADWGSQ